MGAEGRRIKGAQGETRIICPLCGALFDPADLRTCQLCPLGGSCDLVMCPRCNYEFPLEERGRLPS